MVKRQIQKLTSAPIIEALIDIQVSLEPAPSLNELASRIPDEIDAEFPKREERKKFEGTFGQAKGKLQFSATDHGPVGFVLRNDANSKALQVRLDGFGFSHLQPYSDFPTFEEEAKMFWSKYREFAGVAKINRVALLYINVIECSKKTTSLQELRKVLKTVPDISDLGDAQTFHSQIQISRADVGFSAFVTQNTVQNVKTEATGIQLQIDASKQFSTSPDETELWDTVQELRQFKNDIFFDVVTSEQIEKFGPVYVQ